MNFTVLNNRLTMNLQLTLLLAYDRFPVILQNLRPSGLLFSKDTVCEKFQIAREKVVVTVTTTFKSGVDMLPPPHTKLRLWCQSIVHDWFPIWLPLTPDTTMTLNYESSKSFGIEVHNANRNPYLVSYMTSFQIVFWIFEVKLMWPRLGRFKVKSHSANW